MTDATLYDAAAVIAATITLTEAEAAIRERMERAGIKGAHVYIHAGGGRSERYAMVALNSSERVFLSHDGKRNLTRDNASITTWGVDTVESTIAEVEAYLKAGGKKRR